MTRGERLNNPFNIRKSSACWLGKICPSSDKEFEEFDTKIDGIRAGVKILVSYYKSHGLQTVQGIIKRFAPDAENPTSNYIKFIAGYLGVSPDTHLDMLDPEVLGQLARGIIEFENGECIYTEAEVNQAVSEALV